MNSIRQSKSLLTKLLASENINVQYSKVPTASFELKTRTLTLPLWDDMTPELYDLLGGHEVGHALWTPAEGWHTALTENTTANFKTFLNIVEDARIERMIKDEFPGIRKSFSNGYRELMARDFFGVKNIDLNTMLLIDRLNLFFKCGVATGIEFTEDELPFVEKLKTTESWEDVVRVATELFEYCRQELADKMEEEKKQVASKYDPDSYDSDDEDGGDDGDDSYDDGDEESPSSGNDDDNEGDTSEEDQKPTGFKSYSKKSNGNVDEILRAVTDEHFQDHIKTLGNKKDVFNAIVPSSKDIILDEVFVHWKKIYGKIANRSDYEYSTSLLKDFERKNKSAVDYLVKEFEMRKKAAENRRVSISDTGSIDTNLLHTYKFDDNIFRKIASVAEGKNHGIFMLVDWSGSMMDNMKGTIEQMLILTLFCRKAGISFEVCCFSSEYSKYVSFPIGNKCLDTTNISENTLQVYSGFNLLNLVSSKMSNQTYRTVTLDLLNIASSYDPDYNVRRRMRYVANGIIGLGGTPLNESLIVLPKLINEFKRNNRLELVTTVILTDGEDARSMDVQVGYARVSPETRHSVCYVFDPDTKKTHKVKYSITDTLLEILKSRTDSTLLGFYIVGKRRNEFEKAYTTVFPNASLFDAANKYAEYKETNICVISKSAYDEYYLIPGGKSMEVSDDRLQDIVGDANVSTRRLRGAFLKMNQNRLNNRVLLKKFIEQVA